MCGSETTETRAGAYQYEKYLPLQTACYLSKVWIVLHMIEYRTRKRHGRKSVYPIRSGRPHIIRTRVHVKGTEEHRRRKTWHVKGHWTHNKLGTRIWIKPHDVHAREKEFKEGPKNYTREELRFGGHFNEVAENIAREYEKKGKEGEINPKTGRPYTRKDAKEIGRATAADIYREKMAKAMR